MMSCDMVPSLIQCLHTILPSRPDLTDLLIIILSTPAEVIQSQNISLTQLGEPSLEARPYAFRTDFM